MAGLGGSARFENISREDGLPSNDIYGIQSDQAGHLWLATNYGLTRIHATPAVRSRPFTRSHGLMGEEFNYGANHRGPDGKLYFGGNGGFNAFRPGLVEESQYAPPVVLTSLSKEGQPAESDTPIDPDQQYLARLQRSCAESWLCRPSTSRRRRRTFTRICSRDSIASGSTWAHRHHVTFTNLDAGEYMLHVRARASDGGVRTVDFHIPIVKAAAPWATAWAYAAYFLIGATMIGATWRSHRQKLIREVEYSQRLEADVAHRTEELEPAKSRARGCNESQKPVSCAHES